MGRFAENFQYGAISRNETAKWFDARKYRGGWGCVAIVLQSDASKYETMGGSYPAFQLYMQSLQKETKLPPKNRDFHKNIIGTQVSKYLVEYTVTKKH